MLGRDGKGNEVAIKEISRKTLTDKLAESLKKEVNILKSINNENIIKLYGVKKTEKNYYLIMEYCKGGDFSKYLHKYKRFEEYKVQNFIYQISNGLKVLAEYNIIHRDLKLSNLLLSNDEVNNPTIKIADFGFARIMSNTEDAQTFCGTAPNMAPEVLTGKRYNEKVDIWSMGTIIFQLITGYVPFEGKNPVQVLQNILRGTYSFPQEIAISNNCKSIINNLLQANPEKRYNWKQFFEHPFIKTKPEDYLQYLRGLCDEEYESIAKFNTSLPISASQKSVKEEKGKSKSGASQSKKRLEQKKAEDEESKSNILKIN